MSYTTARYFTGKPCARGHVCERYTGSRACIECAAINAAASSARRPWAGAEAVARYRIAHPDRIKPPTPEAQRAADKRYREAHPEKMAAKWAKRRADELMSTPPWFGELDELVMLEAADLCRTREAVTGIAWNVDHMIPLRAKAVCGLHVSGNVQVIPAAMNFKKINKLILTEPGEWVLHGQ